MPIFPTTENDMMALAKNLKNGLTNNPELFPAPPVETGALAESLAALQVAMDRAATETATAEKAALLGTLVSQIKKDLRYTEDAVDRDDAKLKLLGWAARRQRTTTTLPGQTQELVAASQREGTVSLAWFAPATGGKPTSYTVQRRLKTKVTWMPIASTYERSISLANQTRSVELEYSVVATNKAGSGIESNSVTVVL